MARERKPSKSGIARSAKLLGMSGRLAWQSLAGRLTARAQSSTRAQQAQVLVDALSELKGAAMKAGQLLSLDTSDLLPAEAMTILARLQSSAEPISYKLIDAILREELGAKFNLLYDISEAPLAAASIGQVHRARFGSNELAIKIQYPGVAESIDADLSVLKKVAKAFLTLSGKEIPMDQTFLELRRVLVQEVNYLAERQNLQRYREAAKTHSDYVVPQDFPELCTERVLTMSYEKSQSIIQWLKQNPTTGQRSAMAQRILLLFCLEFVEWGFVQTDPNFANYHVRDQTDQLVCLDFGATLEYDKIFRQGYADLLLRLSHGNATDVFEAAVQFGLLSEKENRETQIAFKEMIQVSLEPFNSKKQPFDFSNKDFEKRTREVNYRFSRQLRYSAPPHKILFLHRKLGGVFNLVKRLDVQLDLLPYWDWMTGKSANTKR